MEKHSLLGAESLHARNEQPTASAGSESNPAEPPRRGLWPVSEMCGSHEDAARDRARTSDKTGLDELMREFYRVICFPEGGAPDWDAMQNLFSAHARITRITPEGIDHLDLQAFRNLVEELLELGAVTSLYEAERERHVARYGRVLHVASAYETKVSVDAADYLERGVNSLQIIEEDVGWRILSLCWDTAASGPSSTPADPYADEPALPW